MPHKYTMSDHLCECGCGQYTRMYHRANHGYAAREPLRYVHGHHARGKEYPERRKDDASRIAEFHRSIDKSSGPDACWPWIGKHRAQGYGRLYWHGVAVSAHRFMYELVHGLITPGAVIRHECDNPPCCNPSHLLAGTHADNMADKMKRRRHPTGEKSPRAKLTNADVAWLREQFTSGSLSMRELARAKGIDITHVYRIRRGKNWKHD